MSETCADLGLDGPGGCRCPPRSLGQDGSAPLFRIHTFEADYGFGGRRFGDARTWMG